MVASRYKISVEGYEVLLNGRYSGTEYASYGNYLLLLIFIIFQTIHVIFNVIMNQLVENLV